MRSLRWKLVVTSLVTVFIPLFFVNRYAVGYFDWFTRTSLEKTMIDMAFVVGDLVRSLPEAERFSPEVLDAHLGLTLRNYTERTQTRIRILSPDGIARFDSTGDAPGEDLASLPEVAAARAGGYQARSALTPDRDYMYYYCAQPIREGGAVACVVYVSRHTSAIVRAIHQMREHQRAAVLVALGLAAVIAALFAQTLTRRLRRLTRATAAFARGDDDRLVDVGGRDEIGELARAHNHLVQELARSNDYNREFMSTTMHELRAPITAILGAAELLEHGAAEKPDARAKFLANIRYQAGRLMRLTGELSELTRLDSEALHAPREWVDYPDTVRAIIDRLLPSFEAAHVRFRTVIPTEAIAVRIHPGRIEQVIANLLENAFRYTPPGGEVELRVEKGADREVITRVRNTGDGISPANLPRLFDRFFTTERKDRYAGYGSGLGLSIARSIVSQHKGRIWAESAPGEGACFSFTLPLADESQ